MERPQPLMAARTYGLDGVGWDGAMMLVSEEARFPRVVGSGGVQLQSGDAPSVGFVPVSGASHPFATHVVVAWS